MIIVKTEEFLTMRRELEILKKKIEEYDALREDINRILDKYDEVEELDWNPIVADIMVG